ncbi:Protein arginine N-methyltransferase [Mycena chlorophos]|uniref:Protein arginine N-methyltransferase n=1 Tax=Mycena chlorophos TaxID=658473 RepID=A0A8H6SVG1_MYCCL|nr:Protein arginine N-methyltransferase [Mycena chlorophos]
MTAANEHLAKYEEVLKDGVPTAAFSRLMIGNKHVFKDKTVLNVACGTGLLCLFAAKAVITLVEGKIGETTLPFSEFDIIISDWMGKCLLYESRLEEVILARDKYLKKDGFIYPESVTLYMAAIEDADFKDEKFGFWDNIQGLDYSAFKPFALRDPVVDTCDIRAVVTQPCGFKQFSLSDVKKEDLTFDETFSLTALRDDFIHAFIVWFDVWVASSTPSPVHFSTGPHTKSTRWGQTIFYTRETPAIAKDQVVTGHFAVQPNTENVHDLDIRISYKLEKKSSSEDGDEATGGESTSESLSYKMY